MRAILTYHSVDPSGSVISVDERVFRRHADWLASGRVPVTSVRELLEAEDGSEGLALTFDDGFANFREVAWPILRERGLPATLFVVSSHAGGHNDWGGERSEGIPHLPLLSWDALGRLAEEGVTLGSHTSRHPRLPDLDPAGLEAEVAGSAEEIERRAGVRPEGFAYPYGAADADVGAAVRRVYDWACTTRLAPVGASDDRHLLPRLDAWYFRRPGQLEAWGTPAFRARLGVRRAARRVRALAGRRA